MITRFTCLVLLLSMALAAQAQSITTLQLNHRPASELIPIIQPMLQQGEVLTGDGYKLFLRAPLQTVTQVRAMLEALDRAPRMLQVSVFQGSTRSLNSLGFGAEVEISRGDGRISAGGSGNAGGGNVTLSTDGGRIGINSQSTRKRLSDRPIHQVRVSDGGEAYIETGEQVPIFGAVRRSSGRSVIDGINYKNVVTGFYVRPRVRGETVTLEVSPFKQSAAAAGGSISTQSARTTISGRLGDWLLVGGVSEHLSQSRSGVGYSASTESRKNDSIWIRADLIR